MISELSCIERDAYLLHDYHDHVGREINELKAVIETWKNDYVYLLQSSISFPVGDVNEGWQMSLFGGDRVSAFSLESVNPGICHCCTRIRLFGALHCVDCWQIIFYSRV